MADGLKALDELKSRRFDIVVTDIRMPGMDGISLLKEAKALDPAPEVIVITGHGTLETAVEAIRLGAYDYVRKPFRNEEIVRRIDALGSVKSLTNKVQTLESKLGDDRARTRIIGESERMTRVLDVVRTIADSDEDVLIEGETGTGKELVARALHNLSPKKGKPLVKVNCAALPSGLIESELFGHERGAFTGAIARKIGRFELADGGTIFLDEIGDLPLDMQAKLLRVLQEGEFERVGGSQTMKVEVRVIAATNRDLQKLMAEGKFRSDLFYRLNVFPVEVPALHERTEDIPLLVQCFVSKYSLRFGKTIKSVTEKAMAALVKYDWPGNIRELENVIERAVILTEGQTLELGDWLSRPTKAPSTSKVPSLDELQRSHILEVLDLTGGKVSGTDGAAAILGLKPTTLESRMKKLGIARKP